MRDYVNTKKPTAFQFFWKRHGGAVQFAVLVAFVAIIGSVGA